VEALLEPSKVIKQGFESVRITTTSGQTFAGRIVDESPQAIVVQLSTGELPRLSLSRSEIEEIAPSTLSAMPDNLVDQLDNRDQFLDLVRYLMELSATEPRLAHTATNRGGQTVSPELWGIARNSIVRPATRTMSVVHSFPQIKPRIYRAPWACWSLKFCRRSWRIPCMPDQEPPCRIS
jgi:putative heme-binding domain-containing protein